MQRPRILIIDSGVGGLSVLQEIRLRLPQSSVVYVADNAAYPYGLQSEDSLIRRLEALLPPLIGSHQPDLIVIACNTASTVVLTQLRALTPTPIIGVVPAIKPAALSSVTKKLALLATPGTIQRQYTHNLISEFAADCEVLLLGSNALVQEAENKLRGMDVNPLILSEVLSPLKEKSILIDRLILGCTHFPLLTDEIRATLPERIQLVDSGEAIARRSEQLLAPLPERSEQTGLNQFFFTMEDEHANKMSQGIKRFGFDRIQFLNEPFKQTQQNTGAS